MTFFVPEESEPGKEGNFEFFQTFFRKKCNVPSPE